MLFCHNFIAITDLAMALQHVQLQVPVLQKPCIVTAEEWISRSQQSIEQKNL